MELFQIERELERVSRRVYVSIFTFEFKENIINLKSRKEKILKQEEETWRLEIKTIWLSQGDRNTIFFQKFSSRRRLVNSI